MLGIRNGIALTMRVSLASNKAGYVTKKGQRRKSKSHCQLLALSDDPLIMNRPPKPRKKLTSSKRMVKDSEDEMEIMWVDVVKGILYTLTHALGDVVLVLRRKTRQLPCKDLPNR
jgi:hypothetical protein